MGLWGYKVLIPTVPILPLLTIVLGMERSLQEARGQGEFSSTFSLGLRGGGEEEQVGWKQM